MTEPDLSEAQSLFIATSTAWILDGYRASIRYIALADKADSNKLSMYAAYILMGSYPLQMQPQHTSAGRLVAGSFEIVGLSKADAVDLAESAAIGNLKAESLNLSLRTQDGIPHQETDSYSPDIWYHPAHLRLSGDRINDFSRADLLEIENQLRQAAEPYDGLLDLGNALGLPATRLEARSFIDVTVEPPIDLIIGNSGISDGKLSARFIAAPNIEKTQVTVGIKYRISQQAEVRQQVSDLILWKHEPSGEFAGTVQVELGDAYVVEVMLSYAGATVRREYFVDKLKVPNLRLRTMMAFDHDLGSLRKRLASDKSDIFESAVASLAHLVGFNIGIPTITDAPDLILFTEAEAVVLVECTTRTSDFQAKIGKLVDRKHRLQTELSLQAQVFCCLICAQPRSAIAIDQALLIKQQVLLVAKEEILSAVDRLWTQPVQSMDRRVRELFAQIPKE